MASNAERIYSDLYNTSGADWTKGKLRQQIVQTATELDVDPALALSIARQESRFNPTATGPTGVQGLFQVTKATGKAYGQDPDQRTDPVQSMQAGLRYFKALLTETKGDVPKALMRYNGGSDPNYASNVLQHYELQASTLPARGGQGETADTLWNKLYGTAKPSATPPVPQATPQPAQAPVPAAGPPPAVKPAPGGNPYMPSEMAYGKPVAPDLQEALSPTDMLTLGGAMGTGYLAGTYGAKLGAQAAAKVGLPQFGGAMVGGAAGSLGARKFNVATGLEEEGTTGDVLSVAAPLLPVIPRLVKGAVASTRAGRALSKAEQATAERAAQYAEKGEDAYTAAMQKLRSEQYEAGQKATAAGQQATEATQALQQKYAETGENAYAVALQRLRNDQYERSQKVLAAQQEAEAATVAAQDAYKQKGREAYQAATQEARTKQATWKQAIAEYDTAEKGMATAVERLQKLPAQYLPQLPEGRGTQRASRILYQRLDDVAGSTPVNVTPAKEVASIVQEQLGQSMPAMQPSRLQKITTDLMEMGEQGNFAQVHQALKDLGPLARSNDSKTRGAAKQLVIGLQQSLQQSAMEFPETSGARQLLTQANAAWRQEQAVTELQRVIRPGGTVLKYDAQGRLTVNPQALLNQTEKLIASDEFFAGSFSKSDLAALRKDLRSFLGTKTIPKERPPLPGSVRLKDLGSEPPAVQPKTIAGLDAAPLPGMVRIQDIGTRPPPVQPKLPPTPDAAPLPGMVRIQDIGKPPVPVEPHLEGLGLRRLMAGVGAGGTVGWMTGIGGPAVAGTAVGLDMAEYILSRALLSPQLRPLVQRAIQPNGHIDPKVFGVLAAAMQVPLTQGQPGANDTGLAPAASFQPRGRGQPAEPSRLGGGMR